MPPKRLPSTDHKIKVPFIFLLSTFQCPVFGSSVPQTAFYLLSHRKCPFKV